MRTTAKARFALAVLVGLTSIAVADRALAEPRGEKAAMEQRAKDLFAKGDAAYAEGRYEEALAAFQEAYDLSGRPQLLFNVSNALERLGRYADAVAALDKYLASGKAKDRDVVQKRLQNLKKRVEDQKKDQERLAKEEEERKRKEDEKRKPDEAAPPPTGTTTNGNGTSTTVDLKPSKPTPVVPIVLVATGGAALVAGAVFGIMTLSARSEASDGCKSTPGGHICSADVSSAIDREKTFGLATDISLISGVALTGIGIYLLVSASGDEAKARALVNAPVRIVGRPGGGGLELGGSF